MIPGLDQRPLVLALAGPNGAGKSTFYAAHLKRSGLRLVNADLLARELDADPYQAARMAGALREKLIEQEESFAFETVFSDPAGDKVRFLQKASALGYNVILCFIGISGPLMSQERVAMRVSKGGHDVPSEKLVKRFPRTVGNLQRSLRIIPHVFVFDNDDLLNPYRKIAVFHEGKPAFVSESLPKWMVGILE